MNIDGLQIVVHGMKQLSACHFRKLPKSVLGNAQLMMGTDATEGYGPSVIDLTLAKNS